MLTKTTIALAAVLALGAASASANDFDPWIHPSHQLLINEPNDAGYNAYASANVPRTEASSIPEENDRRFLPDGDVASW